MCGFSGNPSNPHLGSSKLARTKHQRNFKVQAPFHRLPPPFLQVGKGICRAYGARGLVLGGFYKYVAPTVLEKGGPKSAVVRLCSALLGVARPSKRAGLAFRRSAGLRHGAETFYRNVSTRGRMVRLCPQLPAVARLSTGPFGLFGAGIQSVRHEGVSNSARGGRDPQKEADQRNPASLGRQHMAGLEQ
jgi:hypothetical protein